MTIKELREQRVKLFEDSKKILDKAEAEKRNLTAEENTQVAAIYTDIDKVKAEVDIREQHEAEERSLGESRGRQTQTAVVTDAPAGGPTQKDMDLAFRGWALGRGRATDAMVEAAIRCGFPLEGKELSIEFDRPIDERGVERVQVRGLSVNGKRIEHRALAEGTGSAGGFSVQNEVMRAYSEVQKWFGGVRTVANVIQTDTGATLPWPTVDDTANTGELVAEAGAVTTTADPTFGIVNLSAFKFGSKAIVVPVELLQDSFIQLPTYLGRALGTRIGRIQNTKFTTGTGTGEPNGVQNAAPVGKTAALTNNFTFDEVIDLVHSVDPAYRPRGTFMLHDTVAAYVRKLKDGSNRYLWEMSTQVGMPDRMFGFPVQINNDMNSAFTTGLKIILFGEMANYLVRDSGPVIIIRADELRVLNHQSVFVAFQRSDGNLPVTTAIKALKLA